MTFILTGCNQFRRLACGIAWTGLSVALAWGAVAQSGQGVEEVLGKLAAGGEVAAVRGAEGTWGIQVRGTGMAALRQERPIRIDLYTQNTKSDSHAVGYQSLTRTPDGFAGRATVTPREGVQFRVEDRWRIKGPALEVARTVRVTGNAPEGFVSVLTLDTAQAVKWSDARPFGPSVTYGTANAAAGPATNLVEVREPSLTAPLFGLHFRDGSSAAVLDLQPRVETAGAATTPPPVTTMGGLGAREREDGRVELAFWMPGTRGTLQPKQSPAAAAAEAGQGDRPGQGGARFGRFALQPHPIRDGFTQDYRLGFRIDTGEDYHTFYRNAWRWGWAELKPAVYHHDIEVVRRCLIETLAAQVRTVDGRTGIPNSISFSYKPVNAPADWKPDVPYDPNSIMGFTGKSIETAVFLIMDAERGKSPQDAEHRRQGLAIIDTFIRLVQLNPPKAEGFNINNGRLQQAIPLNRGFPPQLYLRSYGDDLKILLVGYKFEKAHGREHPEWLQWCRGFADWLLTQQRPDGGFPRSWIPGTGEVRVEAPQSSYNAVPLLVLLSELTGDPKYRQAAVRAADFCWNRYQVKDEFVGGTIDNPNVQDKEAATLSTEAYLALYEQGQEKKWLDRAQASADNAETYLYIWERKQGEPGIGPNKITASPGTGGDMYLTFDVDEYAKLFKYTGDSHYYDVAKILLHDTKSMMGLPGRTFDLPGPGWQTEAAAYPTPGRSGRGLWLPWVSTSHLNGIMLLEQFDQELFAKLAAEK